MSAICLAVLLAGSAALAQTNIVLGLQLYAGISISGTVGSNYLIQYVTNLSQTNNWQTLTNITLTVSPYLWVDTTTPATGRRFYRAEAPPGTNQPATPAGMALVPAGYFLMGDDIDGETDAPTNTVYVSAFYMDTNLVTYNLWQKVYQWALTNGYTFDDSGNGVGTNYPVQTIDWFDAARWCNARSQMAGLPPVYFTNSSLTQIFKAGAPTVYANWTVAGYRLPTEAEWEKAGRGGLTGARFPWGNTISENLANYYGDPYNGNYGYTYDQGPGGPNSNFDSGSYAAGYTSPVGYFAPNGYSLTDMAGNAFEWCWDWYGTYATTTQTNPVGPATGTNRVLRGGSWVHFANECRTAFRNDYAPTFADDELGFRSVLPQNP